MLAHSGFYVPHAVSCFGFAAHIAPFSSTLASGPRHLTRGSCQHGSSAVFLTAYASSLLSCAHSIHADSPVHNLFLHSHTMHFVCCLSRLDSEISRTYLRRSLTVCRARGLVRESAQRGGAVHARPARQQVSCTSKSAACKLRCQCSMQLTETNFFGANVRARIRDLTNKRSS